MTAVLKAEFVQETAQLKSAMGQVADMREEKRVLATEAHSEAMAHATAARELGLKAEEADELQKQLKMAQTAYESRTKELQAVQLELRSAERRLRSPSNDERRSSRLDVEAKALDAKDGSPGPRGSTCSQGRMSYLETLDPKKASRDSTMMTTQSSLKAQSEQLEQLKNEMNDLLEERQKFVQQQEQRWRDLEGSRTVSSDHLEQQPTFWNSVQAVFSGRSGSWSNFCVSRRQSQQPERLQSERLEKTIAVAGADRSSRASTRASTDTTATDPRSIAIAVPRELSSRDLLADARARSELLDARSRSELM